MQCCRRIYLVCYSCCSHVPNNALPLPSAPSPVPIASFRLYSQGLPPYLSSVRVSWAESVQRLRPALLPQPQSVVQVRERLLHRLLPGA